MPAPRSTAVPSAALLLLVVAACASGPVQPPPSARRHVVVLIHGVLGDASHFGHMAEALAAHLPALDPSAGVEVLPFEYDTLDSKERTGDFARDLDVALKALFPAGPRERDRLSFVMHSQGGLVGLAWLDLAAEGDARSRALFDHVDAFVTLATPYWGSKMATFTRLIEPLSRARAHVPGAPADAQLRDMAFGSDALVERRRSAVAGATPRPARMRPLAVGAFVRWLAPLAPFAAGRERFEDDTAVLLPSSQPNFLWVDARAGGVARAGEASFAPFVVVNAIHLSPAVEAPQASRGVAQVQRACVVDRACHHPAFPLVLAHLAGRPLPVDDGRAAMTSFLVDVVVAFDPARGTRPDDVRAVVEPVSPGVVVGARLEPYSDGASVVSTSTREARSHVTGTLPAGGAGRVRVRVDAPRHAPLVVEAEVRAAESTFVDVRLQPL